MHWCFRFITTDMLLTYFHFLKQCAYKIVVCTKTFVYKTNNIKAVYFLWCSDQSLELHILNHALCVVMQYNYMLLNSLIGFLVVVVFWRIQREKSLLCWMWSSVSGEVTDCSGQTLWAADTGACSQVSVLNPLVCTPQSMLSIKLNTFFYEQV